MSLGRHDLSKNEASGRRWHDTRARHTDGEEGDLRISSKWEAATELR